MCCKTDTFCGCTMRTGIIIAGSVDIFFTLMISIFEFVTGSWLAALLDVALIIADILLIIGVVKNVACHLVTWMVIAMISIVFLFISVIVVPVLYVIYLSACSSSTDAISQICSDKTYVTGIFIVGMVLLLVRPSYYIYLWVVVKNYRENLQTGANVPTQAVVVAIGVDQGAAERAERAARGGSPYLGQHHINTNYGIPQPQPVPVSHQQSFVPGHPPTNPAQYHPYPSQPPIAHAPPPTNPAQYQPYPSQQPVASAPPPSYTEKY